MILSIQHPKCFNRELNTQPGECREGMASGSEGVEGSVKVSEKR